MLLQQLKCSNSIKIEAVGFQSLTSCLREEARDSSPIGTPYIAINSYDHHSTSISNKQSTVIDSSLITDTKLLLPVQPLQKGHNDNNLNLIQKSLVLSPPVQRLPKGHKDNNL